MGFWQGVSGTLASIEGAGLTLGGPARRSFAAIVLGDLGEHRLITVTRSQYPDPLWRGNHEFAQRGIVTGEAHLQDRENPMWLVVMAPLKVFTGMM